MCSFQIISYVERNLETSFKETQRNTYHEFFGIYRSCKIRGYFSEILTFQNFFRQIEKRNIRFKKMPTNFYEFFWNCKLRGVFFTSQKSTFRIFFVKSERVIFSWENVNKLSRFFSEFVTVQWICKIQGFFRNQLSDFFFVKLESFIFAFGKIYKSLMKKLLG